MRKILVLLYGGEKVKFVNCSKIGNINLNKDLNSVFKNQLQTKEIVQLIYVGQLHNRI